MSTPRRRRVWTRAQTRERRRQTARPCAVLPRPSRPASPHLLPSNGHIRVVLRVRMFCAWNRATRARRCGRRTDDNGPRRRCRCRCLAQWSAVAAIGSIRRAAAAIQHTDPFLPLLTCGGAAADCGCNGTAAAAAAAETNGGEARGLRKRRITHTTRTADQHVHEQQCCGCAGLIAMIFEDFRERKKKNRPDRFFTSASPVRAAVATVQRRRLISK